MVVRIESATVVRVLVLVVITLLAMSFVKSVAQPLVLIVISAFLALALNPAVTWIGSKLKLKSRATATGAAYVLVMAFLISFLAVVVPPLVKQTADFIREVPAAIQDIKREDSTFSKFVYKYDLDEDVDQFTQDFGNRFSDVGKPVLSTAGKIGSTLASLVVVLVLTFMMLVEGPVWIRRYMETLAPKTRTHHQKLFGRMYRVVVGYVNGQVIIAALGGIFASIMIFIMSQIFDAPVNAIALGGIIALFALLPLIGTILGSIIVVLACLLVSAPLALAMTIYFVIYQQIENVTIQPYIQSRSNNLTPLIVFLAAILGVGLGGILGAFLAIPTAGCIKILIEDYFEDRGRLPKKV